MPVLPISSDQPIQISPSSLWLELCGWKVPAGFPSPAADHSQKRIDLNDHLIRNKEATFLFRVKGDSMTGACIFEGDTLLVDRSMEPKHNGIVLAVINGEFTVKRLYRRGGVVKLVAENPIYPPRLIKPEEGACPRFCVNGLMAGSCRSSQRKRNDRKQRINRPPAGGLQKA